MNFIAWASLPELLGTNWRGDCNEGKTAGGGMWTGRGIYGGGRYLGHVSEATAECFAVWMVPCVSLALQIALVSLLPSPLLHFIFIAVTSILVGGLNCKNLVLVFVQKFCLGGCSCWASGSWRCGWRVILSLWLCTYSNSKCMLFAAMGKRCYTWCEYYWGWTCCFEIVSTWSWFVLRS